MKAKSTVMMGDAIAMTTDGDDEGLLVSRASFGDAGAFETLVRRYDDQMRAFAYRLTGDRVTMDDVLQDAYLKAFRSLGTYEHQGRFSSWLFSVVHSCAMDHHRRRGRQRTFSLDAMAEEGATMAAPPMDHVTTIVDRDRLAAALAALPREQAAVVALVDGDGFSYEQVADLLDTNTGTVASRLSRGRTAMRRLLQRDEDLDGRTAR